MDLAAFGKSPIGKLVRITGYDGRYGEDYDTFAFLPEPLGETVDLSQSTYVKVTQASAAIARLDQAAFRLPNPHLLARPAIRREAVSTSALEGTYAALDEVLEADFVDQGRLSASVAEVVNYVHAAETAFEWVQEYPITVGLLSSLQKMLVRGTPNDNGEAGRIRNTQAFIGAAGRRVSEARFVSPPPGDQLAAGVLEWLDWINAPNDVPHVVKMALGHYQFETLHPFHDGNGRLGRLVCVLQLARAGELRLPVLNLSPWLEKRRAQYQDHLLACSRTGVFGPWVDFFCEAVKTQASNAVEKIEALHDWRDRAIQTLHRHDVRGLAVRITEDLVGYPITTASDASKRYSASFPGANKAIAKLVELGILEERTGRKYGRTFAAKELLGLLAAD